MPTPKWKLVVDIGSVPPKLDEKATDRRIPDMLKMLAENIPTHLNSPFAPYLPGFTALRLLLLKRNRINEDNDLANTILDSYSSYLASGRNSSETAWMVARDFMLLTQTSTQHSTLMPTAVPPIHQQQPLQQHIGQGHDVSNVQQQHKLISGTSHKQQLHSNQYQQIETVHEISNHSQRTHQSSVREQQNAVTLAPVSITAPAVHEVSGRSGSLANQIRPQASHGENAISTFGHFATHTIQDSQKALSQNGIATLSNLAQHHQITHIKDISTSQNDETDEPDV